MVKNLPLLLAMIAIGGSATLIINQTAYLPDILFWPLVVLSVILNIWGVIGLILHFWVRKVEG
ncbi:hypothetical protein [Virgibacillus halodenitrificans]|uniref:hypothetical protein n=1 Tax=Virgibacillus halodenitrificans TaxID=1482 RepID=UPI001F2A8B33|nr:hypothetical protein [Virgibacillus halodenitrificans]